MRLITAFALTMFMFGCKTKHSVLTKKEFAQLYVDSLIKKHPTVNFALGTDLTITSKKGDKDHKHYIENMFIAYQNEPDSINAIINRYATLVTEMFEERKPIILENIIPVIKPIEYLDDVNNLVNDGKPFPMITEKYNDQLIIAFAEDSKNSIRYLTEDDFNALAITKDSLKSIALKNFDKIVPNIQRQGDHGLFMLTAGGDYEASLILLSSIWIKENFPVDGTFIIAIPNRDMLMITGSKNKNGINKIKEIVADSYHTGNYQISEFLFKWNGSKFIKYD
jgi:uncharacterized protein YtpQ (UPF0354 family)